MRVEGQGSEQGHLWLSHSLASPSPPRATGHGDGAAFGYPVHTPAHLNTSGLFSVPTHCATWTAVTLQRAQARPSTFLDLQPGPAMLPWRTCKLSACSYPHSLSTGLLPSSLEPLASWWTWPGTPQAVLTKPWDRVLPETI